MATMDRPRPLPEPLVAGDGVGVVALSGPVPEGILRDGLQALARLGLVPVPATNLLRSERYLAGHDDERAAGVEEVLARGVKAILAARGGYGVMRVLDRLPWAALARWRGWLIGYSDLTALHAAASRRMPVATLHGPMLASLARSESNCRLLGGWLAGSPPPAVMRFGPSRVVRAGHASGVAVGGNLSVLSALVATPWEPEFEGGVLFLEDVNEPAYRLDRLLTHLALSSRLAKVAAVVVGRMVRCGSGDRGFAQHWRRLLAEAIPPPTVIVEGLAFGHGKVNTPFPLGAEVTVDTGAGTLSLGGN
jgi:muramoyltetrapeptide carboxypeptidase